ncbi:MAG: ferrous iron transport protein B [archaeon]|nr:ferrous iron transport protein B [archaeon]MCP8313232.1 ferrous iron transport protein B [archaeon]MCP8317756.1 ferrous iron transport protein B [archaeon]MCP8320640.1 ferrous iron transport protein B [archaeon]
MVSFPSCHAIQEVKEKADLTIALSGNPNTGKSTIFNQITGFNVITANYPGKTVSLNIGNIKYGDLSIGIIDLPGTYAIGAVSDDQWVARRAILEGRPDAVIVVVDATNLKRNLYLVLQFIELGLPVIVALNMVDLASKMGMKIDYKYLSLLLGVPVIPTVANKGKGIKELIKEAIRITQSKEKNSGIDISYGEDIEVAIGVLAEAIERFSSHTLYGLSPRSIAILLLEGDSEFLEAISALNQGDAITKFLQRIKMRIEEKGEPTSIRIIRRRHEVAEFIAGKARTWSEQTVLLSDKIRHYAIYPPTGIPLMLATLLGSFALISYLGGLLSEAINLVWGAYFSPIISWTIHSLISQEIIARVVLWGLDAGINAGLTVGIPYVLTFYIILSIMEDTGYLNSIAFLTDNVMRKFGLHGRAIIPILTGAGCNVPAIMGTRVLSTKRERIIASVLIVLVPCSARIAVIVGAVANIIGWSYAYMILIFEALLIGFVGLSLNKLLKGESSSLIMEVSSFSTPSINTVLKKTWFRFKDFVLVAFPIVTIGSLILGALYETKLLWIISEPLTPIITGFLGLPMVAGLALILGVLRKELALELLVALAIVQYGFSIDNLLTFMTPFQLFIFALVVTIYIPCIATVSVLVKELGLKNAILISAFTIILALMIGGLANKILPFLGW